MRAGGWGREVLSRFSVSRSHRRAEWIEHDRRFRHDIGIVRSRRDRRSGERLHRVSSAEVRGRSTVEEDRVGADSAVLDVEGRLVLYLDVQVRLVGVAGVAARPTRWRSRRCVDEERRRGGPPPGRPRKPRRPTPGHRVRRRATRRTCREGWPQPAGPEEPEVRGLQRPGSAAEQARGACPETDPPDRHDEGHEQAEGDHGHHRLTRLICPDPGDERGDLDDQLAVSEHRRAGKFPGLGQAG
jgi:hypothetical protein